MAGIEVKIEGLKELEEALRLVPSEVAPKWVNGGLRAAARVIQVAARVAVPSVSGKLKKSIRIGRGRKTRSDDVREYYVIAGKSKKKDDPFYSHMVEGGTKPHAIEAKKGGALVFGGKFYARVEHKGAKAKPFLGPAAAKNAGGAVTAMANYLRVKLDRAGVLNPATETE